MARILSNEHPAPLPAQPAIHPYGPPKPPLKVTNGEQGMILSWDMEPLYETRILTKYYVSLKMFEIIMYREEKSVDISSALWKKLMNVRYETWNMSITIAGVQRKMYHFAMRAVDAKGRSSSYSDPVSIICRPQKDIYHPVLLPPKPKCVVNPHHPARPPHPRLHSHYDDQGVVLEWNMPTFFLSGIYAELKRFEVFGYHGGKNFVKESQLWTKIRDVNATQLPMSNKMEWVEKGRKYYFAVRAIDVHNQFSSFSNPVEVIFKPIYVE